MADHSSTKTNHTTSESPVLRLSKTWVRLVRNFISGKLRRQGPGTIETARFLGPTNYAILNQRSYKVEGDDISRPVPNGCPACRNRRPNGVRQGYLPFLTVFSFDDLRKAHGHGCSICSLYYRGIRALYPDSPGSDVYKLWVFRNSLCLSTFDHHKHVYFYSGQDHPLLGNVLSSARPLLPSHFASEECLSLIKRWTADCEINHGHPFCRRPALATLPTRVIDLGEHDSPIIRLVESNTSGKYIALSHCWGHVQQFVTSRNNIKDRLQGFAVSSLPKTFRDAVVIARLLDVRYLWIDSICMNTGQNSTRMLTLTRHCPRRR